MHVRVVLYSAMYGVHSVRDVWGLRGDVRCTMYGGGVHFMYVVRYAVYVMYIAYIAV